MARRSFARGPRKNKDWGGAAFGGALGGTNVVSIWALSPLELRKDYMDSTVLREQMIFLFRTNVAIGAGGAWVAAGAIAWDGDPDISAVPADGFDLFFDPEVDWLIRMVYLILANTVVGFFLTNSLDWGFSSSAMRKLGNIRGLLVAVEISPLAAGDYVVDFRYFIGE
jgi:hypothetical protein